MGDFVKIKQIENLANQLAQIPKAVDAANAAMSEVQLIKEIVAGLGTSNTAREVFGKLEGKENTPIGLVLSNAVNGIDAVQIFVNGVFINNISAQQGSPQVYFTVPYFIETTDTIVVCYNY
jgi:ethanolamine utilization microcompartment shell protein EutL